MCWDSPRDQHRIFKALLDSGEDAISLAKLSSSTFDAQLEVASRVSEKSLPVFRSPVTEQSQSRALVALLNAVTQIAARVLDQDERGFVALMEQGKAFLAGAQEPAMTGGSGLKDTLYYAHDPMCSWCWASAPPGKNC